MNAKETTTNRTFTLEVNKDELDILISLVGHCNPAALGKTCCDPEATLIYAMYQELESVLGTTCENPKYRLRITKRDYPSPGRSVGAR